MAPSFYIFNQRIIALQCCVSVCHTTLISHKHTYVPSLLCICIQKYTYVLPSYPPPHPSLLSQSTGLSPLCYTATSHQLIYFLHRVIFMSQCHSQFIPTSPSPTVYTTSLFSMSATLLLNRILFCLYSKVQVL